ncbi:MAG: substrate-binding domain-containing protein [Bacilli bacterium]|nr:substrate-binding domain-containing protein [Bacilli bacterium]
MKLIYSFFSCFVFSLTSCSSYSDWNQIGTSNTINYCLLIGQIDHNDSSARTAGIRDVLGTRDKEHKKVNPNTENPIPNEEFYVDSRGVKYRIVEIEHAEQKSISGTTWDQQTANETTTLWINKHYANSWIDLEGKKRSGQSISLFVSNNDGMAMGAIGSVRWIKEMPIFSYDANNDAVNKVKTGEISGTVDQAITGQAAGIYMVARNLIDHPEYSNEEATTYGFGENNATSYGYVESEFQPYDDDANALLCKNIAVTKDNVDKFYNKSVVTRLNENEKIKHDDTQKVISKIYQSYYSATDNFLNSSMKPLFENLSSKFNFEITSTFGNGNDESLSLDNLNTNLTKGKYYQAFILNMVKTTSAQSYLDAIYETYQENGIVNVPVIFWNRQPTDESSKVAINVMQDTRFKHILYVGFDAVQGGFIQGEMIREYIINTIEAKYQYE